MYLGFLLWLAAIAMYISNLAAHALLPLCVAYMNRFPIIPEEKALLEKCGEPFGAYMKTVRRWI